MKSFGTYISKNLLSFAGLILLLLLANAFAFGCTFYGIVTRDYGNISPGNLLEEIAAHASLNGIEKQAAEELNTNQIWAVYLDITGRTAWNLNAPAELPDHFTIQDVAVFSKGYLAGYPVFIRNMDDGMLILGYPKDSYAKLTGNYFSIRSLRILPLFILIMLAADLGFLFLTYYFSKRRILKNTEPIITSIESLGSGEPVLLSVRGELSEIAASVQRAAHLLNSQNQARANWIRGVSHDIRTPLSMVMGYAERIACHKTADRQIREEAGIIRSQSIKIKELVQDLNLVSRLEYEMQPLHMQSVRLSGLLRSYAVELLNTGLPDSYSMEVEITPAAETVSYHCDARLISRAIDNLVQNSIRHNPQGCDIRLRLDCSEVTILLSVEDNGVGLSDEKRKELLEKTHYMESTDDRLNLRHGLGLLLVRQIVEAHKGTMKIESTSGNGYAVSLYFSNTQTGFYT